MSLLSVLGTRCNLRRKHLESAEERLVASGLSHKSLELKYERVRWRIKDRVREVVGDKIFARLG